MTKSFRVAVVGATGAVGRLILQGLVEASFPVATLYALASERSSGSVVPFNGEEITVTNVASFDFDQCDICFFSAGKAVSEQYAPVAVEAGCYVVDNTSAFRYQDNVPLVIPEVNGHVLATLDVPCIISNPNCSTIQMLIALNEIYRELGIKRIIVSTYQAISGAGQSAINRLNEEQEKVVKGEVSTTDPKHQIANNVIPKIDSFEDNGYSREEMKMLWETQKIWQDDEIVVDATAVRVPVVNGHSEAVTIETVKPVTKVLANQLLERSSGVVVEKNQIVTPIQVSGQNKVYVARVRESQAFKNGIALWVVGDNLRIGAAINAINIANNLLLLQNK